MESQGIKNQKKVLEALFFFNMLLLNSFSTPHSLALFGLLLLPFSSFCICAFFHSSPWLCTE